jgi:acyl carrier protein
LQTARQGRNIAPVLRNDTDLAALALLGAGGQEMLKEAEKRRRMSATFETVAQIINETSDIPIEEIKPESHAIDDLGIDSLDFLDIVFALDKRFGIKIPLEAWTKEVNEGAAAAEDYFVLRNLCARIDDLIAAKSA